MPRGDCAHAVHRTDAPALPPVAAGCHLSFAAEARRRGWLVAPATCVSYRYDAAGAVREFSCGRCSLLRLTRGEDAAPEGLLALRRLPSGGTEWLLHAPVDASPHGLQVRAVPGKGLGVVALRAFVRGERLFSEAPLLAWERPANADDAAEPPSAALEALVEAASGTRRALFFGLHDKLAARGGGKTARGVWGSNAYRTEDLLAGTGRGGARVSAVFALACRLNHACAPNAHAAWSGALGQKTVHATRDISAGEEVSVQYIAGAEMGDRAARRALLRTRYAFECSCALCSLDGAALRESEAQQTRLAALHAALGSCPPEGVVAQAEEQCALMEAEGVPLVWAKAAMLLAIVHLKETGEPRAAARWARRGAESARLALGEDSSAFLKFSSLAEHFEGALGGK